jgi:hypothetical protein
MSAKIQYFIRTDRPQSNGTVQVYFVYIHSRTKRLKFATGYFIELKKEFSTFNQEAILAIPHNKREELYCWDSYKQRATKGCKNLERLNFYLTSEEERANSIILEHQIQQKPLTIAVFKKKYFKANGNNNLHDYFINEIYKVRANSLAKNTKKGFKSVLNKIKEFRPNVLLADVDHRFLTEYKDYLIGTCGNSDVTVNKDLKRLRTLIKIAIDNGDLSQDDYAFKRFKLKDENAELTNSDVVEPHELLILESKYENYMDLQKAI